MNGTIYRRPATIPVTNGTVITLKCGDTENGYTTYTVTINVEGEKLADVESITLDKTTLELVTGKTATLKATIKPDNANSKEVTWTSSNSSVVKVENGKITALKAGTATITAKAGKKTATCKITVKEKPSQLVLVTPNVVLSNTTNGTQVSWKKVTNAKGYIVYRKDGKNSYKQIAKTTALTYTDKTAKSGITYTYTVRAYNGNVKSSYVGKSILRLTNPTVSVSNATKGIQVSWKKIKGAKGYIVYRKSGKGTYKQIAKTKSLKYVDKTAKSGTAYTYTVRAYNGSTKSSYTGKKLVHLTTPAVRVKNSGKNVSLSWKKIKGAKGYIVYRKSGKGTYKQIAKTTSLKYTDKKVKKENILIQYEHIMAQQNLHM
ncbi:putative surface protein, responsible for cell interaction [Lachnospiraceae bacterium TWA4]|nr:putative surface protein, responsible for cell interaction [Lachnospiraceae bacterium TWA4]